MRASHIRLTPGTPPDAAPPGTVRFFISGVDGMPYVVDENARVASLQGKPGGETGHVQFNDGGGFGASEDLTFDHLAGVLSVTKCHASRLTISDDGFAGIGANPASPLDVWAGGQRSFLVTPDGHVQANGAVFLSNGATSMPMLNQFGNRGTITDGLFFAPVDGAIGFTDGAYTHNSNYETWLERPNVGLIRIAYIGGLTGNLHVNFTMQEGDTYYAASGSGPILIDRGDGKSKRLVLTDDVLTFEEIS